MTPPDEGHWDGTDPDEFLAAQRAADQAAGRSDVQDSVPVYQVLIEQHLVGISWSTSQVTRPPEVVEYTDQAEARAAAARWAYEYEPNEPMMPGRRTVYQVNPDSYLAVVEGTVTKSWFVARAARLDGVVEY